ncbi:MAG: RidA family protein [Pseudomonadota bacterium]
MAGRPLPPPPAPAGGYAPFVLRQDIGVVSGQFPIRDGALVFQGRIGAELTPAQGRRACEIAALNVLAQIHAATDGFASLDGLLRLDGHVASADGFHAQPVILDAASRVLTDRLGRRGAHARTAFAPPRLPLDAPVELCATFAVR